ncbi:MAG: hypothetical protein HXX10_17220 [Rhodoplanes sp.]|uniref:hypothetical protein n=1 Tax=Rhodoplanes sp. TaxID=1968906 RepID=UPI0017BA89C6|nr:hypothetical protein [Rhodoplanes sp.]NVO15776.1 hypothetical protein [Rhodoplanes sp.]
MLQATVDDTADLDTTELHDPTAAALPAVSALADMVTDIRRMRSDAQRRYCFMDL